MFALPIGKAQSWKRQARFGNDIISAKQVVDRSPTKDGISSYGGKSFGGRGQAPLKIIAATVGAGYKTFLKYVKSYVLKGDKTHSDKNEASR